MISDRGILIVALLACALASCEQPVTPTALPLTTPAAGQLTDPALAELVAETLAAAEMLPGDASRRATLGLVYEANQVWDLAEQAYQRAAELDPSQPEYPTRRAICLLRSDRQTEAETLLRETLQRFSDFAPAHYHLGALLLDQGDPDAALVHFASCEELADWFRDIRVIIAEAWIAQDKPAMALALIDEFLPGRSYDLRAHYVRGLALEKIGRSAEANQYLSMGEGAARSFLPDKLSDRLGAYILDTNMLLRAAEGLKSRGQDLQAQKMLKGALKRKPEDAALLNCLAMFERRLGNATGASDLILRAITLAPNEAEYWINASLVRYDLGRHPDALNAATKAIELEPENAHAQYLYGRSLRSLNRLVEARAAFAESLRLDEASTQTRLSLSETLVSLNQFAAAKPILEELLERTPDEYWARHYLCISQLRLGFSEQAKSNLEVLKKAYPGDSRLEELDALFR